jgi:hypothetical protein
VRLLAELGALARNAAAAHAARLGLAGAAKTRERRRKTGESSRSGTRSSRHTVALNSSRAKETVMHSLQHIRRLAGVLAGPAAALVAFGATPAFATLPPPEPASASHPALSPWQVVGGYQVPGGVQVHTVVTGGMPGWQITLIAVGAALLAATVAVLADRARASRRKAATAAA